HGRRGVRQDRPAGRVRHRPVPGRALVIPANPARKGGGEAPAASPPALAGGVRPHQPGGMFQRILVANRGEIALRVIRACRDLGVEVVAVFSEADRGAPYLALADEAICIGPAPAADSYLNIPRLISAAEIANVQAIHPGYGFLAENPHFAEVCRSCNIEFIGPSQEAMRLLGNKSEARKLAKANNVPVVPGSEGLIEDEAEALRLAHAMGFSVLIKAAAGGGGRGMRVARNDISLRTCIKAARQEAEKAFKEGSVYVENFV